MHKYDLKSKKPFKSIWFGNFFEPAYNDKNYIARSIKDIENMGFTSVELDSKSWQDFFDRYEGKDASEYVKMQEYMIQCIKESSLGHWFLAIYLNGDNLYPSIRFSPPVIGEGVIDINGLPQRYYRYWSQKAQDSMIVHVKELFSLYPENHTALQSGNKKVLPICSMWDPIAAPSFDEDGINRYHMFLKKRYDNIELLNKRYMTDIKDVCELMPEVYWVDKLPAQQDIDQKTPVYWKHADNQLYKAYELTEYFKAMQARFRELNENLYLMPNLSQWSIFLNINTGRPDDLWDTSNRGIDPYWIAQFVDDATFMTVPMLPDSTPNPYVSEYQNSMMRSMNEGRPFTVGFYLGRHIAFDIYREITPAEIIGSAVASGADGYHAYGYCGLDDGGVMHKLGKAFKKSITDANKWMDTVIPKIKGTPRKQVALLFPSQMSTTESYSAKGNENRRLDSLGLYQAACDNGMMIDVIHIDQIEKGILSNYEMLLLPQNSCYEIEPSGTAEKQIKEFVENGGVVISTVNEPISQKIFAIKTAAHPKECIRFKEGLIPAGTNFRSFEDGEEIAHYEDSKLPAAVRHTYGKGKVYSFGYAIGEEYLSHKNEVVPPQYGNRVFYPLNLTNEDPFSFILQSELQPVAKPERGISYSEFDNGLAVVNHTSYPFDISSIKGTRYFIHNVGNQNMLIGHSAVFIEY